MVKSVTQRQKDERARRKAMPIALIQRPLRLIASLTNRLELDKKGGSVVVASGAYKDARGCANKGNGAAVQSIARSVLS